MSRVILLGLVMAAACSGAGCQKKSETSPSSTPAASTPAAGGPATPLSADDQLMLDYLQLRNEVAELLEKKAPEAQLREVSARSGAKLKELQALPRDRQMAVQLKYQKQWDAANERVGKAITGDKP
ncbi:MAG: hypothetical protein ACJ8F7_11460 [Gemmataceae bacterium]